MTIGSGSHNSPTVPYPIEMCTFPLPAGRDTPYLNEVTKNKEQKLEKKKSLLSVGEESLFVGCCLVDG